MEQHRIVYAILEKPRLLAHNLQCAFTINHKKRLCKLLPTKIHYYFFFLTHFLALVLVLILILVLIPFFFLFLIVYLPLQLYILQPTQSHSNFASLVLLLFSSTPVALEFYKHYITRRTVLLFFKKIYFPISEGRCRAKSCREIFDFYSFRFILQKCIQDRSFSCLQSHNRIKTCIPTCYCTITWERLSPKPLETDIIDLYCPVIHTEQETSYITEHFISKCSMKFTSYFIRQIYYHLPTNIYIYIYIILRLFKLFITNYNFKSSLLMVTIFW